MSAHTCTTLTEGCYRCELHRDEAARQLAEDRADAQKAWIEYRDAEAAANPGRFSKPRRGDFIAGFMAGRVS